MALIRREIGDILVDNGQITQEQLDEAKAEHQKTGEPIGQVLAKLGLVTKNHVKNALELQYGVNYVALSDREPDPGVQNLLSEDLVRKNWAVPIAQQGDRITVAMVDPSDSESLAELKSKLPGGIKFVVCLEEEFVSFVDKIYGKSNGGAQEAETASTPDEATDADEDKAGSPPPSVAPDADEDKAGTPPPSVAPVADEDKAGTPPPSAAPAADNATEGAMREPGEAASAAEDKSDDAADSKQNGSDEPSGQTATESKETSQAATGQAAETESSQEKTDAQTAASESTAQAEEAQSQSQVKEESEPKKEAEPDTSEPADKQSQAPESAPSRPAASRTGDHPAVPTPEHSTSEIKIPPEVAGLVVKEDEPDDTDHLGETELAKRAQEEAIVLLANQILGNAIKRHCSNIHIVNNAKECFVHYRANGNLTVDRRLPKTISSVLVARFKMMARLNLAERKQPQDGHIKVRLSAKEIVCLVSILPTQFGENIVIWIL